MAVIKTHQLTKCFGDLTALDNLTFSVNRGEVYGFLGPNGAGKSTTINLLLDYLRPTSGTATVLGYDAQTNSTEIRQQLGILPDGFALYDRLTGRQHLQFAIDSKNATDTPDELLARVGLDTAAAARPAGDYSTGMTQRLALAMALVGDPDLLILDEPTAGLDPHGAQLVRDLVRAEAANGTTVFFSSHRLDQVEAVCDRVGIMRNGHLVAQDTVGNLHEVIDMTSTLTLHVDQIPADLALETLDGVQDVTVEDSTIHVACSDSSSKSDVILHLETAGATITDFTTQSPSLADVFTAYTRENAP